MRRFTLLLLPALLLLPLGHVACTDDDDDGTGGGGSGGFAPAITPDCPIDLAVYGAAQGDGGAASASQITDAAQLIGGEAASGMAGDFLLQNGVVRVIVQQSSRAIGANPYGGNLIDADLVRPAGEPGRDVLGEIAPFYNFGRTTDPDEPGKVGVLADGSDGGAAIVIANARDTQNDFLNVRGMIGRLLAGLSLTIDSEAALPLKTTNYYVLPRGARAVHYVTAMCNTGAEPVVLAVGDLIDSGGKVDQFQPHASTGGWNYASLPEDFPWIAYEGDGAAYALVPGDGAQRNQALTVSGVTGTLQGSTSFFDWVEEIDPANPPVGAIRLAPGGTASYVRRLVIGRNLGELTDAIFALQGGPVGRVSGRVQSGGAPAAGARIAATRTREAGGSEKDVTETVLTADADGRFAGALPAGTYRLSAALPSRLGAEVEVTVGAGAEVAQDLEVPAAGTLTVKVRDLAGGPLPGRVHVLCAGTCASPRADEGRHRNVLFEAWPAGVVEIAHAGADGEVSFALAAGSYEVLVARGAEYDTFPVDWPLTRRGAPVTVAAGGAVEVVAPLARVIDTTGWVSADFHVHAINSPDAPVPNLDRVRSFMGEGVEILVATDHDYVTDLAPYVEELGGEAFVKTIVGSEITTFDFGHVNAFPMTRDESSVNGGAVDWAGGRGNTLTPAEILAAARERGAPVLQVNHARGALGMFDALKLDTGTSQTHADPVSFRMAPNGEDPSVDSRLFSPDFTALEVVNGFDATVNGSTFRTLFNDWMTFNARGMLYTATAVSDTHQWYSGGVGLPRSWVKLGLDAPAEVDPAELATAINARKVIGSTGPFLAVEARAGASTAGVGETLSTGGATNPVELRVTVQAPRWAPFNRIEVYSFREGTASTGGVANANLPREAVATQADGSPARATVDLTDPAVTAPGAEGGTERPIYKVERTFTFAPAADTFYVVLVRAVTTPADGLEAGETAPAALDPLAFGRGGDAFALAFSNAILVDVDGNGYDAFPIRRMAPTKAPPAPARKDGRTRLNRDEVLELIHLGHHH